MYWLLMIGAMMVPLTTHPIRHVVHRSFRRRRHAVRAFFLMGYVAPWIALGAGFVAVSMVWPGLGQWAAAGNLTLSVATLPAAAVGVTIASAAPTRNRGSSW